MPFPRSRSFLPLEVPGGTFTSALPSMVATVATVPRIARSNAMRTSEWTSLPSTRSHVPSDALTLLLELGVLGVRRGAVPPAARLGPRLEVHRARRARVAPARRPAAEELAEQVAEIEHSRARAL